MHKNWPEPEPLCRKPDRKERNRKRTLPPAALEAIEEAVRNGESIDPYMTTDDRIQKYCRTNAEEYGMVMDILMETVETDVNEWFIAMFSETTQDHRHTKIEVVKNPYDKAAMLSGGSRKGSEPQNWVVRAIVGGFDTHEKTKPYVDRWKDPKNRKIEFAKKIAEASEKKYWFACVKDFEHFN